MDGWWNNSTTHIIYNNDNHNPAWSVHVYFPACVGLSLFPILAALCPQILAWTPPQIQISNFTNFSLLWSKCECLHVVYTTAEQRPMYYLPCIWQAYKLTHNAHIISFCKSSSQYNHSAGTHTYCFTEIRKVGLDKGAQRNSGYFVGHLWSFPKDPKWLVTQLERLCSVQELAFGTLGAIDCLQSIAWCIPLHYVTTIVQMDYIGLENNYNFVYTLILNVRIRKYYSFFTAIHCCIVISVCCFILTFV